MLARFFQPSLQPFFVSLALLLLRLVVGVAFIYHGQGKIQNPFAWMGPDAAIAPVFQFLAAVAEFGGGIALIAGLLTPLFSFGLICTMAVAVHMHAVILKDPFVSKGGSSYELALVYLVVSILLLVTGPGVLSLDRIIFGPGKK